jgi:hypothetical protein
VHISILSNPYFREDSFLIYKFTCLFLSSAELHVAHYHVAKQWTYQLSSVSKTIQSEHDLVTYPSSTVITVLQDTPGLGNEGSVAFSWVDAVLWNLGLSHW